MRPCHLGIQRSFSCKNNWTYKYTEYIEWTKILIKQEGGKKISYHLSEGHNVQHAKTPGKHKTSKLPFPCLASISPAHKPIWIQDKKQDHCHSGLAWRVATGIIAPAWYKADFLENKMFSAVRKSCPSSKGTRPPQKESVMRSQELKSEVSQESIFIMKRKYIYKGCCL